MISACYELLEWRVALMEGSTADGFLGMQVIRSTRRLAAGRFLADE
jgi:uncharacterized membrane protein YjdF